MDLGNDVWYVYYWRIDDPGVVAQESFATYEEAAKFYDEIMERGPNWDAYIAQEDPVNVLTDYFGWR